MPQKTLDKWQDFHNEIARLRDELSEKDRKYRQDLTELAQAHLKELDKRDEEIARLKKALVRARVTVCNNS